MTSSGPFGVSMSNDDAWFEAQIKKYSHQASSFWGLEASRYSKSVDVLCLGLEEHLALSL